VAVFRKRAGDDQKLGGDTTGPAGRWQIIEEPIKLRRLLRPRAREAADRERANGYICEKDRSPNVVVD
jgi:hypothetical protein